MEISTVPAHYVKILLDAAQQKGLDRDLVLRNTQIEWDQIDGDRARLPSAGFRALSEYLTAEMGDENVGLLSQSTKVGTFAMMCNAAINSATLGQFLQRCIDFNDLVSDCVRLELKHTDEEASYSVSVDPSTAEAGDLMTMILLSITHRLANWALGKTIALETVSLVCDRPSHANEYNFLFMSPVRFQQPTNSLHFAAGYLDMPVVQNEQELEKFLATPSLHLMTSSDADRSLVTKVRAMIKDDVAGNFPEFSVVADALHLTTATLRRRLRAEGSSYQQLKDDIRRDIAIHNLSRGSLTVEEVAQSVGFSEPTSFFRAFKRWTGVTPRVYFSK